MTTTKSGPGGLAKTYAYGYDLDPVGRLTHHARTGFAENWTLDDANNWQAISTTTTSTTTESRTHNANNELTARGATSLTYDLAGNLINNGTHSFKWDFKNRLREVRLTATNALVARYEYDADYHRLKKFVAGQGTTTYLIDGDREAVESGPGGLSKTYVYGNYIDEVVAVQTSLPVPRTDDPDGFAMEVIGQADATVDDFAVWLNRFAACQGGLAPPCPEGVGPESVGRFLQNLVQPQSVGTTYFHQDDLYSTRLLTNTLGQVTDRYAYDPYGRVYHLAGSSSEARLFSGRLRDAETGMYYHRTRYYSPEMGRFINRDTIGTWGDSRNWGNGFAYCGSLPIGCTDAQGKWGWFDDIVEFIDENVIEPIAEVVEDVAEAVVETAGDVVEAAADVAEAAGTVLTEAALSIANAASVVADVVVDTASAVWDGLQAAGVALAEGAANVVRAVGDGLEAFGGAIADGLKVAGQFISAAAEWISNNVYFDFGCQFVFDDNYLVFGTLASIDRGRTYGTAGTDGQLRGVTAGCGLNLGFGGVQCSGRQRAFQDSIDVAQGQVGADAASPTGNPSFVEFGLGVGAPFGWSYGEIPIAEDSGWGDC